MLKFLKNIFLLVLLSCTILSCRIKCSQVEKIANNMENIDVSNNNYCNFIDNLVDQKDIIIIGEASHGDGKTFEIKSDIFNYLVKSEGFNTIAFEQRDFFEMEFINNRSTLSNIFDEKSNDWERDWSPWGNAVQIQKLVDVCNESKLNYIGLETYSKQSLTKVFPYIELISKNLNVKFADDEVLKKLREIIMKINATSEYLMSNEEYEFYLNNLYIINTKIDSLNFNEKEFMLQVMENLISFIKIYRLESEFITDENENLIINLRDLQMARNLVWFKKNNPDKKIIIWLANFHGAKKISEIKYANGDPLKYKKLILFGEHIVNKYTNKVYSLAITSSTGISKMPYNFEGVEETIINSPENSLEYFLIKKKMPFGFINFNKLYKKYKDVNFNSIMLGYVNQNGYWLKLFDGLFYIRENQIAMPLK